MTARDRIPGTKKLAGVAVGVDTTETFEKKSRKTTGIPSVSSSVSPRRSVMKTSAPVCARSGRRAPAVVLTGRAAAARRPAAARHLVGDGLAGHPHRLEVDVLEGLARRQVGEGGAAGRQEVRHGGGRRPASRLRWPRPGSGPPPSRSRGTGSDGGRQRRDVERRRCAERDDSRPPALRPSRPCGVPSRTTRPAERITMRSAIFSASPSSWVVRTTHTPRSFNPATTARTAMRPSGSTPAVGSSRKATSGRPTRARASESRCCSPPERWRQGVPATARNPTRSSSSSAGTGSA